jgi:hypothetical protein
MLFVYINGFNATTRYITKHTSSNCKIYSQNFNILSQLYVHLECTAY